MADLRTEYLGLALKSPVIAGSSGLTGNIDSLKAIAAAGAGAVVLKSVFEEEIYLEFAREFHKLGPMDSNLEFLDYYDLDIKKDNLKNYLSLISEAKAALDIPVIASINCVTSQEWGFFAQKIEAAGADAIELNMFISPANLTQSSHDNESIYFDVITRVTHKLKIPVSVKISPYFSNLGGMIRDLSFSEIKGLVLFNRFYHPDIDVEDEKMISAPVFSQPVDYTLPLRWVGMMANRVNCDLVASTGVHSSDTAIKMLLAGAKAVQIVSTLYTNSPKVITDFNYGIIKWMGRHHYKSIDQFRGKLAMGNTVNPAEYERVQFMKTFGEYK